MHIVIPDKIKKKHIVLLLYFFIMDCLWTTAIM